MIKQWLFDGGMENTQFNAINVKTNLQTLIKFDWNLNCFVLFFNKLYPRTIGIYTVVNSPQKKTKAFQPSELSQGAFTYLITSVF